MIEENPLSENVLAKIENKDHPDQVVDIHYVRSESAFITSGIEKHFGMKEILVPVHLVVIDFELIGAILSTILERLSRARESESTFSYASNFEVLGRTYSLLEEGAYVKLCTQEAIF